MAVQHTQHRERVHSMYLTFLHASTMQIRIVGRVREPADPAEARESDRALAGESCPVAAKAGEFGEDMSLRSFRSSLRETGQVDLVSKAPSPGHPTGRNPEGN